MLTTTLTAAVAALAAFTATAQLPEKYEFVESELTVHNTRGVERNENTVEGSAPIELTFTAFVPDTVVYATWEIAAQPGFENPMLRFNATEFTRSFMDYGTFYVRFYGTDDRATTEFTSITYIVNVYQSELECPNTFTPYGSPGINDEWKVKATSIVSFECVIFNKAGQQIARLDNVEQGWDGRYRGKLVSPGVYYYVISARGADGRDYRKSGSISILGNKTNLQP